MGNILRLLSSHSRNQEVPSDVFVDFENCQPSDEERAIWEDTNAVLSESNGIIAILTNYRGAAMEIRDAINFPNDQEKQQTVWDAIVPLVENQLHAYNYSKSINDLIPKLLAILCTNDGDAIETLERKQALFKQFAEILDFCLNFDDLKMRTPSIQNDFSFYRRRCNSTAAAGSMNINRNSVAQLPNSVSHVEHQELGRVLSNEVASHMSLFFAQPNPMLKTLIDATTQFKSDHKEVRIDVTTECLAAMTHICRGLIANPELRARIGSEATQMFCLRVMTGVIILYDHVHPVGAFAKSSNIDVKSCIRLLKDHDANAVEGLMNSLRYSSRHVNDESTPRAIKAMLAIA